jgi:hypothetical protein
MICPRRGFHQQGEATYIANGDGRRALPGDADVNDAMPERQTASHEISPQLAPRPGVVKPVRPRPPRVECGDLPFLIKRDGTWLYRGSPIGRKELVCLFSSVLKRSADGDYWLETPVERGRIQVEDVPWLAVEMDWTGNGRNQVLSFRTNVDQVVAAGAEHPIRVKHDCLTCEPTPYITIRCSENVALEARIGRAVYYELVALAVPGLVAGRRVLGVWSQGQFFSLGDLPGANCDCEA